VETAGDFEEVVANRPLDVNGALFAVVAKWLPGPVSSFGSGAVKGSRRYLEAWKCFSFRMHGYMSSGDDDPGIQAPHTCLP
jgi:hypothetical protein